MIEETVLNHMEGKLSVFVGMEVPDNPPSKYVVIEKTSSSRVNHIDSATFAFQSYAPTMREAAELNEEVKAAADSLIENDLISKAALNSDYNFTDTSKKGYRYQAVYNITYH